MPVAEKALGGGKDAPRLPKGRLIVVDEDRKDLSYYSAILTLAGYEVRGISSFSDGAAFLEQERFDLVIVSQGGAAFEGQAVLARAIELDRRTPVLVLTYNPDVKTYMDAMQLGARDYVEKPLAPAEISKLVAKHLHRQGKAV